MRDGFWRARDNDGLVHHVHTFSEPMLDGHNDFDYDDRSVAFCDRNAGDWPDAADEEPTTCFVCFTAWHKLEAATSNFLSSRKRGSR